MGKALITWWTKGIGFAIAKKLAQKWYDICITYLHDQENADNVVQELLVFWVNVLAIEADSWNENDLKNVFDQCDKIDVLINNIWSSKSDPKEWEREDMFNHHLMWTVNSTELFISQLIWEWTIINISSIAWINPWAWHKCMRLEAYCCMKAAVNMYTKICASKFAGKVWVNAIAPWNTLTPSRNEKDKESIAEHRKRNTCIWRLIDPDEVANITYAVIGNNWITWQIITIDGWEVARWYEKNE